MRIRFKTNTRKALEVILWFANRRPGIGFHSILKLLFFADKSHLNKWGRPIVGDSYRALPYGPVAQTTYDILKCEPLALEVLELNEFPFEIVGRHHVQPRRPADLSKLSESDVEALHYAWENFSGLTFDELTRVSHRDRAYHNAEMQGRLDMHYGDFLEGDKATNEAAIDLADASHRMRV